MHSSYYIYEGESTNNYVSEVKNCLLRFKTPYLMLKQFLFIYEAPSMFKCKIGAQFRHEYNHSSNIDSFGGGKEISRGPKFLNYAFPGKISIFTQKISNDLF